MQLKPLLTSEEYSDVFDYASDLYNIVVPGIELRNINMLALINKQEIRIGKSIVNDASIKIFRDERLEIDPERRPETLQGLIHNSDFYLKADTILVKNSSIELSSVPANRNEPATLLFENFHLMATNITNDSLLIEKFNVAEIEARAQFMGESLLELKMDLYLDDPNDLYVYEGSLNSIDFTDLNPIFENLMPLRIEDGVIQRVSFSVSATREMAKGIMRFYYDDLDLQLIDKENPQASPGLWLQTSSWLVNAFMIKSQNPTKRGKFRLGEIEVQRDLQRSIFKNMGDAMIDGVSSSIMTPFVEKVVYIFVGD